MEIGITLDVTFGNPIAIRRLGWKMPKILNAGDRQRSMAGLIGNLSLNEISASVMMLEEYELSLVMDLSHKVILLAPDSDMDRVAKIIQQRGSGWSNLLVSNSPQTSEIIEAKLASLTLHPRGLFLQGGYSTLTCPLTQTNQQNILSHMARTNQLMFYKRCVLSYQC